MMVQYLRLSTYQSVTNFYITVGGGPSSTIKLGKMEPYFVVTRGVEGPDRVPLKMFPCPEDVISGNNDGRLITKEIISWGKRK